MSERIACSVPFCRRTRGLRKADDGRLPTEFICADHWRLVPRATKARYAKARRLLRRAAARGRWLPSLFNRADASWVACKTAAIECAMGISA